MPVTWWQDQISQLDLCRIACMFSYWENGTILPNSVITKVRQIAYRFICDGKKSSPWARMVLPKELGGLGISNFKASAYASYIKRISYFWSNQGFLGAQVTKQLQGAHQAIARCASSAWSHMQPNM